MSLGAPNGDFQHVLQFGDQAVQLERIGTNGSVPKALELLHSLDGQVAVLCLGGVNLNYLVGERAYPLPLGQALAAVVRVTPLVDGSWLKEVVEPLFLEELVSQGALNLQGKRVLLVSALDRPALARTLDKLGAELVLGDAMFGLGLPLAFRSLVTFNRLARLTMPVLRRIPLHYLYPLGDQQNAIKPRFAKHYQAADFIAGDFHFIYRHLPASLAGKQLLTSTVRAEDLTELRRRGLQSLITLTPLLEGRALGANLWEGVLRAVHGGPLAGLQQSQVRQLCQQVSLAPAILELNKS